MSSSAAKSLGAPPKRLLGDLAGSLVAKPRSSAISMMRTVAFGISSISR
jgi:hypothetical protein